MPTNRHPIPRTELPPGWGLTELGDDRFAYRHSRPPIVLVADVSADQSHPRLGICRCWELCYQYSLGDRISSETIGRVSTRQAAVDGLLECMRSVHDVVSDVEDPVAVDRVLDRVSLSCFVPESTETTLPETDS
ncbi:hypothetical protein [Natrialba swarupiae]|uniref:Uncharacterized protein n=1 Tax=Natrialba swarupiae TaxID=2448032 RepID=A0A5D5AW26_9EURY|nr:hypothetical protein [Natrialba swarupiae]TYT63790.1 hypothetical protein FYC77_00775 [Natrialba swarupiae]